jgi:DNA repair exonuclease SbcCD ATPase subunit|tara:strand:+ start:2862 stop:4646 length:1785 start_codon:yes stop_codon:yes gene_type:complete
MILIKTLTVKNFMSVGNQTQAIDFQKKLLTLVLGENLDMGGDDAGSRNGTGKTTIVNALCYALYGEALTKIRKDNLVNKTNSKSMLVTIAFEKDGVNYRVERGRKPNVMKYYIDEQEQELSDVSQGDSRKTQEDLNRMIGMNPKMFKHIVALNTYTQPFLSLHNNEQQEIIEQLLGIQLLSEKADILKTHIKRSKEDIALETARLEGLKISNEKVEETIHSLTNKSSAWHNQNKTDIEKLENNLQELQSVDIDAELEAHQKLEDWTKLNDVLRQLQKDRASLESTLEQADKTAKKLHKDLEKLNEKATCYACGQDLPQDKIEEMQKKLEMEYGESNSYVMELSEQLEQTTKDIEAVGDLDQKPNTYYDTLKEAYDHRQYVESINTALKNKKEEANPYLDQIDELKNQAVQEINWDTANTLQKLKEHQEFLYKLLTNKDSFIRKKIIDQNLTFLNNRLTHYLDQLGLPHLVTFKNDLSVEITQLGQELDFDNLSRGERNRLILGLSFAFRDVWENLYQNINLLFLDELIDSGMDSAGVESSLAILKKMSRESGKNIFLISHKDELMGRVNNVLKVVKENGFTAYANDVETYDHSR